MLLFVSCIWKNTEVGLFRWNAWFGETCWKSVNIQLTYLEKEINNDLEVGEMRMERVGTDVKRGSDLDWAPTEGEYTETTEP